MSDAMFCEHANECPSHCPCGQACYCRQLGNTCAREPAGRPLGPRCGPDDSGFESGWDRQAREKCAAAARAASAPEPADPHEAAAELAWRNAFRSIEPVDFGSAQARRALVPVIAALLRDTERSARADERARCLQAARTGVAWHLVRNDDVPHARKAIELAIERLGDRPHSTTLFALYRAVAKERLSKSKLDAIERAAVVLDAARSGHFVLVGESTRRPIGCLSTSEAEHVVHALLEDRCDLVEVTKAECPNCKE